MVLAECTGVSEQYMDSLQQLATLEMKLVTLPVPTKLDAAKMLVQLVRCERYIRKQASVRVKFKPMNEKNTQIFKKLFCIITTH